jgi:hypothetical protein
LGTKRRVVELLYVISTAVGVEIFFSIFKAPEWCHEMVLVLTVTYLYEFCFLTVRR